MYYSNNNNFSSHQYLEFYFMENFGILLNVICVIDQQSEKNFIYGKNDGF